MGFSGGSDVPTPIMEGKVDGDHITFKVGNSTYAGTVKGDRIELERSELSPPPQRRRFRRRARTPRRLGRRRMEAIRRGIRPSMSRRVFRWCCIGCSDRHGSGIATDGKLRLLRPVAVRAQIPRSSG